MRILAADDDLLNRRILEDIFTEFGQCDLAVNGYDALEAYQRAMADKTPYDLITLDIVMPGMDGREVLKSIRGIEESAGSGATKIIMVTSEADADSILASYDYKCDAYITKPIERQKLTDRMRFLGLIA